MIFKHHLETCICPDDAKILTTDTYVVPQLKAILEGTDTYHEQRLR
jgi:hypothetical protein